MSVAPIPDGHPRTTAVAHGDPELQHPAGTDCPDAPSTLETLPAPLDGVRCCWSRSARRDAMTRTIQHLNWAALGANLGSALLFTLLLLSPFLWGAPLWHWLLAVAIALVLGLYFYVRREHYEEPGPDADELDSPASCALLCP